MKRHTLGIDLGTSGAKAVLISETGEIIATVKTEYELHRPREGWAEQDPEDWWTGVCSASRQVLAQADVQPAQVRGVALSGQMHGSVFLDAEGSVIRPPILWNDTRTTEQCDFIRKRIGREPLMDMIGNPVLEGFTAPKLLWLRDNEPDNYDRLKTMLLPKDYIVYRMTGKISTEPSDAAGTVLFNVKDRKWADGVVNKLELDGNLLPPVVDSTAVVGKLKPDSARALGLKEGTAVIAGGADNACSAVGNGVTKQGRLLVSTGSSGVVLAHTDKMEVDREGRLHSFNHVKRSGWYLMGVMLSAGLSLRWFRDSLGGVETAISDQIDRDPYELLTEEAATAPPGAGKLIFLPYLNGERTPHSDPDARGVFFGLTGSHRKGHLVRSILEGVTFGLRDSLELIKDRGIEPEEIRVTGGGANSELWAQIQSDVFGQPVKKASVNEGPAFGAALLAAVGVGIYEDVDQATEETVGATTVAEPDPKTEELYDRLYKIYRSLYTSVRGEYEKLASLAAAER